MRIWQHLQLKGKLNNGRREWGHAREVVGVNERLHEFLVALIPIKKA